jgi:hypothetical protein
MAAFLVPGLQRSSFGIAAHWEGSAVSRFLGGHNLVLARFETSWQVKAMAPNRGLDFNHSATIYGDLESNNIQ